ncbi:MAG: hypothetical protein ACE367_08065 [Acidimicrobiales bacterium]
MIWVFIAAGAVAVLAIAWFAVSMVTARLAATPSLAVFDIEEATTRLADQLPDRVAARLSHDDVRVLLRWQLTYFRERGVASYGGVDRAAERAARMNRAVVADEDDVVDELLRRCRHEGIDADEVDIVCVVDLTVDYLVDIGAVGSPVDVSGVLGPATAGDGTPALGPGEEGDPER